LAKIAENCDHNIDPWARIQTPCFGRVTSVWPFLQITTKSCSAYKTVYKMNQFQSC
jgi:hypothetical protein